jgi:hypothetical protein
MKVLHNSLLLCTSALLWYQTPTAPQLVTGEIKWKIGSNKWYSKVEVKKPPSGVIRMLVRSPGWYLRGVDGSYGTVSFESPGTLEELRKNGWKKATGNRFPTFIRQSQSKHFWSAGVIQIRGDYGLLCRFQGNGAVPRTFGDRVSKSVSLITR